MEENLIQTVYQPIINLADGSVMGYEAFSRGPEQTCLHAPAEIIAAAKERGMTCEIDCLFVKNTLLTASLRKVGKPLFINIEPVDWGPFHALETITRCEAYGIRPEAVIIELPQGSNVFDIRALCRYIRIFNGLGINLAYDDFCLNHVNFDLLRLINPRYIKINRKLVMDIGANRHAQSVVKSILDFSRLTRSTLIASGVETRSELLSLLELGVKSAQGYYLAMPGSRPSGIRNEAMGVINKFNRINL